MEENNTLHHSITPHQQHQARQPVHPPSQTAPRPSPHTIRASKSASLPPSSPARQNNSPASGTWRHVRCADPYAPSDTAFSIWRWPTSHRHPSRFWCWCRCGMTFTSLKIGNRPCFPISFASPADQWVDEELDMTTDELRGTRKGTAKSS